MVTIASLGPFSRGVVVSFSADKFFGFYLLNISCIFLICVSTSHWPSHRCQHLWPGTLQSPQSSPAGTQAPPTCTPQSFQSGQIRFCHVSHSTLTPLVIFFSIDFRMSTTTFSSWPEGVRGRVPIHFPSLVPIHFPSHVSCSQALAHHVLSRYSFPSSTRTSFGLSCHYF